MNSIDIRQPLTAESLERVKDDVIRLWTENAMDTEEISRVVGFSEAWCHHIITRWRERQIKEGKRS
ncbi:hypothetical protein V5F49_20395 [Xanthobacter sp. V3C-3]|uniref:hypothetical protein n=1 Tax=Xanthobacter lutulentifluminis TaxID=3119935 RepID=UPI00372B1DBC